MNLYEPILIIVSTINNVYINVWYCIYILRNNKANIYQIQLKNQCLRYIKNLNYCQCACFSYVINPWYLALHVIITLWNICTQYLVYLVISINIYTFFNFVVIEKWWKENIIISYIMKLPNFLKKVKPAEVFVLVVFVLYLIFPVTTPSMMSPYIESPLGM